MPRCQLNQSPTFETSRVPKGQSQAAALWNRVQVLVRLPSIIPLATRPLGYDPHACQIAFVTTELIIASNMLRRFPTKKYVLEISEPSSV